MEFNKLYEDGMSARHPIFSFLLVSLAIFALSSNPNHYQKRKSTGDHFIWPADLIEHLVLGYKLPFADLFWIRMIQDMDFKDKNLNGKTHLGWSYRMADAITNLDRRYRMVYIMAGTTISIGVEDAEGARLLMEKGVKYYPHDWSLLYRLAYHYMYEIKNCEKAAYYLNESGKYGAPIWVISLAARFYTHAAQYELAYRVIEDNLKRFADNPNMVKALMARKEALEKSMRGLKGREDKSDQFAEGLCH